MKKQRYFSRSIVSIKTDTSGKYHFTIGKALMMNGKQKIKKWPRGGEPQQSPAGLLFVPECVYGIQLRSFYSRIQPCN
jgi:hypothetical protein